jgi:hypothetical protein
MYCMCLLMEAVGCMTNNYPVMYPLRFSLRAVLWIRKFWPDTDQDPEKIIFDLNPGSSGSETKMK